MLIQILQGCCKKDFLKGLNVYILIKTCITVNPPLIAILLVLSDKFSKELGQEDRAPIP